MAQQSEQIAAVLADLDRYTAEQVVGLTLDLTANLVLATPVDLGWARAGWVPSIGSPAADPAPLTADATPAQVSAARGRQEQGTAQVLGYSLGMGSTWVTNGVDYIQVLNDGHSQQAPRGYVQQVITQTALFSEHSSAQPIARSSFDYRPGQ